MRYQLNYSLVTIASPSEDILYNVYYTFEVLGIFVLFPFLKTNLVGDLRCYYRPQVYERSIDVSLRGLSIHWNWNKFCYWVVSMRSAAQEKIVKIIQFWLFCVLFWEHRLTNCVVRILMNIHRRDINQAWDLSADFEIPGGGGGGGGRGWGRFFFSFSSFFFYIENLTLECINPIFKIWPPPVRNPWLPRDCRRSRHAFSWLFSFKSYASFDSKFAKIGPSVARSRDILYSHVGTKFAQNPHFAYVCVQNTWKLLIS